MILQAAKDELVWEEVNHHVLNRVNADVARVLQCEILYYKNDDLSVRSTLKLQELKSGSKPFSLNITSYTHIAPNIMRLEFTETKHLADYETLEDAQQGALSYYRSHYHPKHNHHYHFNH